MKSKAYILMSFILLTGLFPTRATAADSKETREQQIKAAFLYNFINFVEWPKEKIEDDEKPIVIGIVGDKNFIKSFDPIKDKQIKGKDIIVKYFEGLDTSAQSKDKDSSNQKQTIKSLQECHIVFLCHSDPKSEVNAAQIKDALENSSVLLVGEQVGFLENGGHINFLVEKKKIRFEINFDSAKHNGLTIRSKLLKLATRVIKEGSMGIKS